MDPLHTGPSPDTPSDPLESRPDLEHATAKVRTSALARHGIHRLRIVSKSRLRQLLEAATDSPSLPGEPPRSDRGFRAHALEKIEHAESLLGRLRSRIGELEAALATYEASSRERSVRNARDADGSEDSTFAFSPLEARRLRLIREMMLRETTRSAER